MDQGEAINTAARAQREQELLRRIHEDGDGRARDQLAEEMLPLARYVPGITVDVGYAMADRIHNTGLAIVWSGHQEPAELYWEQLCDAGLTMAPLEQG